MCTLTAMDNVRKAYDEYHYSSDCFDFRKDARLDKMTYLIKGNDETSNKIADEVKQHHHFFSIHTLDMNLSDSPDEKAKQEFKSKISKLNLQGTGMLIADKNYYSDLIEENPSLMFKLALVRPSYDSDYIKMMVDFTIGRHYASRVRVLKEKNASKEGISSYYKNIMPFDVMVLPSVESLRSLVSAAYIYQEIKLRHNITPKVYVQCLGELTSEKELVVKLLDGLCVDDINFIDCGDKQTLPKIVSNHRVLFVTPQRCSLKKHHEVEEMRKEIKFSPRFYVVKDCELEKDAVATKVEELVEKHQAYLKHLFKI